jgi:hypothetical protein
MLSLILCQMRIADTSRFTTQYCYYPWLLIVKPMLLSLLSLLPLSIVWFRPVNKTGLTAVSVLCALVGLIGVNIGTILLFRRCNGDYTEYYATCYKTWVGFLQLFGAFCMIGAAACSMVFVCGPRFQKYNGTAADDKDDKDKNDDPNNNDETTRHIDDPDDLVIPAVIPFNAQQEAGKKKKMKKKRRKETTASDSISYLSKGSGTQMVMPDGSVWTETESINSDGCRVITTTTTPPPGSTRPADDGGDNDSSSDV